METGSKRFTLNGADLSNVGKGSVSAAIAALATYLVTYYVQPIAESKEMQSCVFVVFYAVADGLIRLIRDNRPAADVI